MARDTGTAVQAVPPRGAEAVPQGRALPDGQVRRRASLLPAGRARPRPHETERVPRAAAREAEGQALLRRAGETVRAATTRRPRASRASPARTCCAAGVPPGQRARAPRLRRVAPPGAPADPPRPLDGQRPAGEHPQLPGAPGRRDRRSRRRRRPRRWSGTRPSSPDRFPRGSRPTTSRSRPRCCASRSDARSPRRCRSSSSSSCTRSSSRPSSASPGPGRRSRAGRIDAGATPKRR